MSERFRKRVSEFKKPGRKARTYDKSRRIARVAQARGLPSWGSGPTEWKVATNSVNPEITSTATWYTMNGLAKGTNNGQRVAEGVVIRSMQLFINLSQKSAGAQQSVRIMLVQDKQTNGAGPVITDVVDANTTYSMRNLVYRKRFKILLDKRMTFDAVGGGHNNEAFSYYKPCYIPVQYNGQNNGDVQDITSNALFLIVLGEQVSGNAAMTAQITYRIRYTDV